MGTLSCLSAGTGLADIYADQVWSVSCNPFTVNSAVLLHVAFDLPRGAETIALKSELGRLLKRQPSTKWLKEGKYRSYLQHPGVDLLPFLPVTCSMGLSKFLHRLHLQNGNSTFSRSSRLNWCTLGS